MSEDDAAMLARIDERLRHLERDMDDLITRVEFKPVALIAYGLAGLLLSSLVAAIVSQALR